VVFREEILDSWFELLADLGLGQEDEGLKVGVLELLVPGEPHGVHHVKKL